MVKSRKKETEGMNPNGLNDRTPSPSSGSEEVTKLPSNDVFSSYIFSTSSRSLSKYGERLLMEVISVAQEYTYDAALGINKLNFSQKYQEKFAVIDIPVKNLLNADDTTNYTKAKEAAVELMKIYHTVESPVLDDQGNPKTYSDGSPQYQFASFHLLDRVTVNQKPGIVSVKLGEETWSQILDMGKGYTRYNLLTAKSLDDVVAVRLFQILSNTSEPLYFSLERIKGILGLQDKYVSNPTGFIRRVIEPAEREIKEKCPFEVVHELAYDKAVKKGRPAIVGLTFSKILKPTLIKNPQDVLDAQLLNVLASMTGAYARTSGFSWISRRKGLMSWSFYLASRTGLSRHTALRAMLSSPCRICLMVPDHLRRGSSSLPSHPSNQYLKGLRWRMESLPSHRRDRIRQEEGLM